MFDAPTFIRRGSRIGFTHLYEWDGTGNGFRNAFSGG